MRVIYLVGTLVALAAGLTTAQWRVFEDAQLDPSLMDERGLEDVEGDDVDVDQDDEPIPEAQNYYQLVVGPQGGWWQRNKKKIIAIAIGVALVGKRSVDAELLGTGSRSVSDNNAMGYIIGTEAEDEPYRSREGMLQLGSSKVIQADLYERRLVPGLPTYIQEALGGKQSGVVITLEDGRKFLVVKGNQYGKGKAPALIPARRMAPDWKRITSKAISNSYVSDFISAAKRGYDVINNNGNQAADRMMKLP